MVKKIIIGTYLKTLVKSKYSTQKIKRLRVTTESALHGETDLPFFATLPYSHVS